MKNVTFYAFWTVHTCCQTNCFDRSVVGRRLQDPAAPHVFCLPGVARDVAGTDQSRSTLSYFQVRSRPRYLFVVHTSVRLLIILLKLLFSQEIRSPE